MTLAPYIDQSSYRIPPTFSLERGFNLFRAMGLSHITVVDKDNQVVGILSRKDLTNMNISRALEKKIKDEHEATTHARDEERGGMGGGGGGGGGVASSVAGEGHATQQDEQPRSVGGTSRSARAPADVQLQESHSEAIAVAGLDQGILI